MSPLLRVVALAFPWVACVPDESHQPASIAPDCTIGRVFDALPECPDRQGDGRIDVGGGCADDGCVGMTAAQLEEVWDAAPLCDRPSAHGSVFCAWPNGISTYFDEAGPDGSPHPSSAAGPLFLAAPYDGTTPEGLGVGVSQSCFLAALGDPDLVTAVDPDDGYTFRHLAWTGDGVNVYDPPGDGVASIVALGGAR